MEFFKFLTRRDVKSKNVAKERLKAMLESDRQGISPEQLNRLKEQLLEAIGNLLEYDATNTAITLSRANPAEHIENNILTITVPVIKVKAAARPERAEKTDKPEKTEKTK